MKGLDARCAHGRGVSAQLGGAWLYAYPRTMLLSKDEMKALAGCRSDR